MIHFNGKTLKFRRGDSGVIVISLTSCMRLLTGRERRSAATGSPHRGLNLKKEDEK